MALASDAMPMNTQPGAPPAQAPLTGGPFDKMSLEDIIRQQLPYITQGEQGLASAAAATPTTQPPIVKTGLQDEPWMKMESPRGKGFGGGVLSILKDVGRGALAGVAATGPGRAVQESVYGPGERRRQQQQQNTATSIEEAKTRGSLSGEEAKAGAETVGGMGGALYKQGMLGINQENAETRRIRADQNGQKIAQDHAAALERLSQGWDRLDQGKQKLEVQRWYDEGLLKAYNARIQAGQDENSARIGSQQDMEAAKDQSSFIKTHPYLNAIMSTFGMEPPAGTSVKTPGAAQPTPTKVQPAGAKPSKSAAPPAGATHAVKVNGRIVGYSSDGGKTMTPVGR